jgi:phosphoserine aminotransferase
MTSNETIQGVQWFYTPEVGDVPLVCDMSSDIFSRKIDVSKYGLIYAGAQKNLGPSGVTVVIVREDLLARSADALPTMMNYKTHAENGSMYNTPPAFGIYILGLVLKWLKGMGGLPAIEAVNERKAALLYTELDRSGFWTPHADASCRSRMNVTFRLATEELEKAFAKEATAAGLDGLKGHRSVGGIRASIYNSCLHCSSWPGCCRGLSPPPTAAPCRPRRSPSMASPIVWWWPTRRAASTCPTRRCRLIWTSRPRASAR